MPELNQIKIPNHVALIMDGNRRWARERNLSTYEGHFKGYQKIHEVPGWFFEHGVKTVSFYAFSTENWSREREEVNYLMSLMQKVLEEDLEEMHQKGYRLFISGRIEELPGDLPQLCNDAMVKTKDNIAGTVNLCLNYGGRAEILDAIKKMVMNNIELEQIHEGMVRKYLYHGELPDPEIIVRTSGEQRLSGFLLWQSPYSELMFLEKYWPDFEERDVELILEDYNTRQRRFGK